MQKQIKMHVKEREEQVMIDFNEQEIIKKADALYALYLRDEAGN